MFFSHSLGSGSVQHPGLCNLNLQTDCRGINRSEFKSWMLQSFVAFAKLPNMLVSRDPMDSEYMLMIASSSDANFFYCLKY